MLTPSPHKKVAAGVVKGAYSASSDDGFGFLNATKSRFVRLVIVEIQGNATIASRLFPQSAGNGGKVESVVFCNFSGRTWEALSGTIYRIASWIAD